MSRIVAIGSLPALLLATLLLATLLLARGAAAKVSDSAAHGFTVKHVLETPAAAPQVYEFMTTGVHEWWNGSHSWSGDAANLYVRAEPGGCFCERLPGGGGVEHLRIIFLSPGAEIRFDGALGPLQNLAVQGRMIWKIEALEEGSIVTFIYRVHGYLAGGFEGLAPAVDGVIGEQLNRLGERLQAD